LPKRLAENPCQFSENFNHNNHIGGPDGQAFPLPSRNFPARTRKTAMGGAIRIDSIGFSGKAAPSPVLRHCPSPLTDRSKPTEGRRCFYLAVGVWHARASKTDPLTGEMGERLM
jgi:hypothetical protein